MRLMVAAITLQDIDMSKGSKPRPIPNRDDFERNWDTIFGKKK